MTETTSTTFIEPPQERKIYIPNDEHDDDIESFVSKRQEYLSKPVETTSPTPAAPKRRAAARKRAAKPAAIIEQPRIPDPEQSPEPQEDKTNDPPAFPSISSLRIEQNFSESDSDSSSSDSEPPETPREHVYRPPNARSSQKETPIRQRKQSKTVPVEDEAKPKQSPLSDFMKPEELDRATMISKIILYRNAFSKRFSKSLLAKVKKVEVSCKLSDEELRSIMLDCRLSSGATTTMSLIRPLFRSIMSTYEMLAQRVGIKIEGITEKLIDDPGINDILTEISIEFVNIHYIPPHYRLVMNIMYASAMLHRFNVIEENKKRNSLSQAQPTPVQPDKPIQPTEKFVAVRADNVPDIDLDEVRKAPQEMKFDSEKYKDL